MTKRKRPRRLILVEPNGYEGHAAFVNSLCRVLKTRYRVLVVTRLRPGVNWCVPVVRLRAANRVLLYWKIFRSLSRLAFNDDVIHFQSVTLPMAVVVLLLRVTNRHTVLADTVHNVYPHNAKLKERLDCLVQRVFVRWKFLTDVFVLSEASLAYGSELAQLLRPDVRIVLHQSFVGRQRSDYYMAVRRLKGAPSSPLRILFFGVARNDKGIKEFLAGAKLSGGLDIDLRIIGSFPDYDPADLQGYVDTVSKLTVLPGFATEQAKNDAFEWCDFCLLPHLVSFKVGSGALVDGCERAAPVISVSGSSVAARVVAEGCGVVLPRNRPEQWRKLLHDAAEQTSYYGFLDAINVLMREKWGNDQVVASGYNYSHVHSARNTRMSDARDG